MVTAGERTDPGITLTKGEHTHYLSINGPLGKERRRFVNGFFRHFLLSSPPGEIEEAVSKTPRRVNARVAAARGGFAFLSWPKMRDNDRRRVPPPKGLKPVLCMMEEDRPELEADDNVCVCLCTVARENHVTLTNQYV